MTQWYVSEHCILYHVRSQNIHIHYTYDNDLCLYRQVLKNNIIYARINYNLHQLHMIVPTAYDIKAII